MTIQLNTIVNDTNDPLHSTEALIAIDLSSLGVSNNHFSEDVLLPSEHINFPVALSACAAAVSGGVDVVSLSRDFFAHSYTKNIYSNLDPAKVARQLIERLDGGFCAEIPANSFAFDKAIDFLSCDGSGWGSLEIRLESEGDLDFLESGTERAHVCGLSVSVRAKADFFTEKICKEVASWADAVHIETPDPHVAREIRFALRSAANELGRSLKVFCELGILISSSVQSAQERAWLISAIDGTPIFDGKAHVVGTVYDAADEAERWFSLGAADGLVFLPASVPTDLASLIRGVLPVLRARGSDNPQSLTMS